jgi:FAD:protein FMN transferase
MGAHRNGNVAGCHAALCNTVLHSGIAGSRVVRCRHGAYRRPSRPVPQRAGNSRNRLDEGFSMLLLNRCASRAVVVRTRAVHGVRVRSAGCVVALARVLTVAACVALAWPAANARAAEDRATASAPQRIWQSHDPQARQWQSREWTVMTTRAFVEFRSTDADVIRNAALFDSIVAEFERINAVFSPWLPGSELSRINKLAATHAVAATPEMFELFIKAGEFTRLTGGAFDASFAAAGELYDYRRRVSPDDTALQAVQSAVGWSHIILDQERRSIRYAHPETRVDFGGIAKGYAIDRVVAMLKARGITDGYVALGGDSYVLGTRNNRPWQIGIRHPRDAAAAPIMIPASNLAVSTSGDYERFFDRDGERVHHILTPQNGRPAHGVVSVTILAANSITADALSTGVFVLGREKGLALVNGLPDVSAIIIDESGKVFYSDDLLPLR